MTEKRFTIIGTQIGRVIRDNETDVNTGDIGIIFNWLNELNDENTELKQQLQREHTMLDNAILLERTRMGKNSLIQYKEAIM